MHYAVLVFTHTEDSDIVDMLLSDYDENLEVPRYIRYTPEQAEEEGRKQLDGLIASWKIRMEKNSSDKRRKPYREAKKMVEKLSAKSGYEYIRDWYSDEEEIPNDVVDAEGNIWSTYNPKSKWDWYVEGGRFDGCLRTKYGEATSAGYAKDLDWGPDADKYKGYLRFWELIVDGDELHEGETMPFSLYNREYYLAYYKDKETFARICSSPISHAVVTPDGEWHEKGEMGWFSSSETAEESLEWDLAFEGRFVKEAIEQNYYCTIVDCHI